jgi:hypothetical protein
VVFARGELTFACGVLVLAVGLAMAPDGDGATAGAAKALKDKRLAVKATARAMVLGVFIVVSL